MNSLEAIEKNALMSEGVNISENLSVLNKSFKSAVSPENGAYGVTRIDKGNGLEAIRGKNEAGRAFIEYYQDGILTARREYLGNHQTVKINYDDLGNAYLKTFSQAGKKTHFELTPDTTIVKGNFSATTDACGRTISTKVTDLRLKEGGSRISVSKLRDKFFKKGDEVGHGVSAQFGGPASKENVFAQSMEVNRCKMRKVENLAAKLKREGHTVDYEIRANYGGTKNTRPTSFEPKITVDGQDYALPDELKIIYNTADDTFTQKAILSAREKLETSNEVGIKSGLVAAGVTLAVSSVDNITACVNGEISGEEAAVEIVKDTAASGGLAYGAAFASTAVSNVMRGSSRALLQRVGNSCLPAAAASFAVESADSIMDFAQGKIDGAELTYDLGESAVTVAGSFAGGAMAGAALGTVAGPAGTVAGGIAGGVVGCAVVSEVYAAAVEIGDEGVQIAAEQAEKLAKGTIELVKENIPDKVGEVTDAFNDFVKDVHLPFSL